MKELLLEVFIRYDYPVVLNDGLLSCPYHVLWLMKVQK